MFQTFELSFILGISAMRNKKSKAGTEDSKEFLNSGSSSNGSKEIVVICSFVLKDQMSDSSQDVVDPGLGSMDLDNNMDEVVESSLIWLYRKAGGEVTGVIVPESVLKKQKRNEEWALAKEKNAENRKLIFKRAQGYTNEYENQVKVSPVEA